jgi:hypothetical protein
MRSEFEESTDVVPKVLKTDAAEEDIELVANLDFVGSEDGAVRVGEDVGHDGLERLMFLRQGIDIDGLLLVGDVGNRHGDDVGLGDLEPNVLRGFIPRRRAQPHTKLFSSTLHTLLTLAPYITHPDPLDHHIHDEHIHWVYDTPAMPQDIPD